MSKWILAGDIGGTKINVALFEYCDQHFEPLREGSYPTHEQASLPSALKDFLGDDLGRIGSAAFGVPGAVTGDVVKGVNLPWDIDRRRLAAELGLREVGLINDLVANGYGVSILPEDKFEVINMGRRDPSGNGALISAGTGLGEGLLIWNGRRWQPQPSEGGHTDFSPTTETEVELLRHLMSKYGRVSSERVVSGPGLYAIYCFLRDTGREEEPPWLAEQMTEDDPSVIISRLAQEDGVAICKRALEIFIRCYGAEAGNLAIKMLATGGVFIGGGIAPKLLDELKQGDFMEAFLNKGRMRSIMEDMPVKVVLEPRAALFGAAHYAQIMEDEAGG